MGEIGLQIRRLLSKQGAEGDLPFALRMAEGGGQHPFIEEEIALQAIGGEPHPALRLLLKIPGRQRLVIDKKKGIKNSLTRPWVSVIIRVDFKEVMTNG